MAFRFSGPFTAFRIADRRYPLFDGMGSYLTGNRWNSTGQRVIYSAETYAGALLETLVRSNLAHAPERSAWIHITVPPSVLMEEVASHEVPGWDAPDRVASRQYGDRWYLEGRTAVLLVPSMVTQGIERNALINQAHPHFAAITATEPRDVGWDSRLFRR